MPRISAEREEATRQRILDAAKQVFIEKGFDRTTIDDVVAASGLSVGAIYNYFRNKDELIRVTIDEGSRRDTEALLAETRAVGTIPERLDRSFRGFWTTTIEVAGGPAILTEAWAEAPRHPLIRDLMGRRFERIATFCSVILREGVDRGELRPDLDVEALARAFADLLEGLVVEYVVTGGSLRRVDAQKRFRLIMDAQLANAAQAPDPATPD